MKEEKEVGCVVEPDEVTPDTLFPGVFPAEEGERWNDRDTGVHSLEVYPVKFILLHNACHGTDKYSPILRRAYGGGEVARASPSTDRDAGFHTLEGSIIFWVVQRREVLVHVCELEIRTQSGGFRQKRPGLALRNQALLRCRDNVSLIFPT